MRADVRQANECPSLLWLIRRYALAWIETAGRRLADQAVLIRFRTNPHPCMPSSHSLPVGTSADNAK